MKTTVLDHGYVELVESWGSDQRIIEAARMSTDKGFLGWEPAFSYKCKTCGYSCVTGVDAGDAPACPCCSPLASTSIPDPLRVKCMERDAANTHRGDAKLLGYLWRNAHHTPFEMAGLTLEVQAPIFVFREWHRHRTQSYNELSARYTPLPDVNYIPTVDRLMMDGGANKQAQGTGSPLTLAEAERFRERLFVVYGELQDDYTDALDVGVPKELARLVIPVGRYSRMRASANLRNWLAFCTLRMDARAQWEIRAYANIVGSLISERFPRTWALFNEGK